MLIMPHVSETYFAKLQDALGEKMEELGHDRGGELPSRKTLARYLKRLTPVDTGRAKCALCPVHVGAIRGISEQVSEPIDEGQEMNTSDPRSTIDISGATAPGTRSSRGTTGSTRYWVPATSTEITYSFGKATASKSRARISPGLPGSLL
jgi:hypothetical protein